MENEIDDDLRPGDIEQEEDAPEPPGPDLEEPLKTLEATPGFLNGKLRTSSNPVNRAKHEEILRKRSKLIARQHARPSLSAEDALPEGQEQIKAELEELENTPGFMDGKLAGSSNFADKERHAELLTKRSDLIARLQPDADKPTMQDMEEQNSRLNQAKRDMSELVSKFDYQKVVVPKNVTEKDAAGLHLQLLSARHDFEGFSRFVLSAQKRAGFTDEQLSTLTGIARMNISTAKKQDICDQLLMAIFEKERT